MNPKAGVRGDRQDFHAFEHRAPEPGELANDQDIVFAYFIQNARDLSPAPRVPAGSLLSSTNSTRPISSRLARARMTARLLARPCSSPDTRRNPTVVLEFCRGQQDSGTALRGRIKHIQRFLGALGQREKSCLRNKTGPHSELIGIRQYSKFMN